MENFELNWNRLFEKQYISVKQLASMLGVSEKTIYKMVKNESIPHIRLNSSIRFSLSKIQEWTEEQGR